MSGAEMGLPEALERAASELPELADRIRPANGDPHQLARQLDAEAAARLLSWLLTAHTACGEELAAVWADEPETAGLVAGLDTAGLPKAARKVMARLAHRLRSRGEAPPRPAPAPRATTLAPLDEHIDEARISAPDPYGSRVVYLAADRPAGGVRLFQLVLHDEQGVQQFEIFETGRSKVRQFLRDVSRRGRGTAAAVPSATARRLIAEALAAHPADRALPAGLGDWRSKLVEHGDDTPRPGELARSALSEAAELDADQLAAWIAAGEVGPWPPPVARLEELLRRLQEIADGKVLVSGAARDEQVDAALEEAVDGVYDAERFERLARRLDDTAWVWARTGRESEAPQLLAAASALRAGEAPARRLARRMLELALRPALERARNPEPPPAAADAGASAEAAPGAVTG